MLGYRLFKYVSKKYLSARVISTIKEGSLSNSEISSQPKSLDEIPGPPSLPIIKQLHHFYPGGSLYKLQGYNLHNYLYETYGPIVKLSGHFGGPDFILLYDAESAAQVFRTENVMSVRPGFTSLEYYRKNVKKKNSDSCKFTGLMTDQGDLWRELRSMINPIMMQPKSIKNFNIPLDEVAQEMVQRMKYLRNQNNIIRNKFSEEMNYWALESLAYITLGRRLNCFDPNLPMNSPVRKLIEISHEFFKTVDKLDFKPNIWRYYQTKTFKQAMNLFDELENLNAEFINDALQKLKIRNTSVNGTSILEKLIAIDSNVAVLIVNDLLTAGFDTVANMITLIFYLLAKHPEKQNKLREELSTNSDRRPYLKACIKEGMRLLPVGFGNTRTTTREYTLLGFKIPKNTNIISCHQYMCSMECHYPKPKEYIPERWIVDKDDPLYHGNAHPFAFGMFGYGARGCIGRKVAEMELEIFLARVIENFQIEWNGEPLKIRQNFLFYPVEPLNFIFKDA